MTAIREGNLPGSQRAEASEERALTLAFKSGDEGAYGAIYQRYLPRVLSISRRMLGNPDDAKEAAQETFLRVYQSLGRFNGRYQLGAWITRITTNVCLDNLRARSRRPVYPSAELGQLEGIDASEEGPEALFLKGDESRRVRRVLRQLPPLHKAAIVLREFEGMSYDEIAVALNLSDCQVKALLHRARKGFKRSWTSGLVSALVPAKLSQRRRGPETPQQQAAQAASAASPQAPEMFNSAAHFASSCGVALQSCGQFLGERAAPIFAAALVTTAAGAGAVALHSDAAPRSRAALTAQTSPMEPSQELQSERSAAASKADGHQDAIEDPVTAPAVDPVEPVPAPVESPLPDTDPAPDPEPQPDPDPDPKPEPDPTPSTPPEPAGFTMSFGSSAAADRGPCDCLWDTAVDSEYVGINDQGLSALRQSLRGTASAAGTPAYGLQLQQWSGTGSDHGMEFRLYTGEGSYVYSASGSLVDRTKTEWGGWIYRYHGTFRLGSRPTRSEVVPESGAYSAEIVISPSRARLVSETFSLDP